jgi:hypothetical protein
LSRLFRGELDWIVMKALEKDRNRRYETANAFAMDVQRYLSDEPVQACPPSAWYRFRKFTRRKKTALAFAGLILFFIALLSGGAGWMMRDRANRQTKAANELDLALDRAELFQGQGIRAEALAALERAHLLAVEAQADSARDHRMAALERRLEEGQRDQEFIGRFEDIRLRVQSQVDLEVSNFTNAGMFPALRDALTRYGIEIGMGAPSQAAAIIDGRPEPVREYLLDALDDYLRLAPNADMQTRQWPFAALDALYAADTDAWRVRARKALASRDGKALEQLAREADERKQPLSYLLSVAESLPEQMRPTQLDLLRRIQRAYPQLWGRGLGRALAVSVTLLVLLTVLPFLALWTTHNRETEWIAVLSPFYGPGELTAMMEMHGHNEDIAGWAIIWSVVYLAAGLAMFVAALATFDRCMGRITKRKPHPSQVQMLYGKRRF